MKIGIDLDGVIFDTEKEFRVYSELYDMMELHRNSKKDNRNMRFQDRFDWTTEEINDFLSKYHKKVIEESSFMPGVKDILKKLKEDGHDLILITARGGINKEMIHITEKRLKQNNLDIFDKYYWAIGKKDEICTKEHIDIMIDDFDENCKAISDAKVKTIYLKDAPSKELDENEYLKVLYNWGEIYRYICEEDKKTKEEREVNVLISINRNFLAHSEEMLFSLIHYCSTKINIYMMYQESEIEKIDIERLSNFISNAGNAELIPIKFDMRILEGARTTADDGYFFGLEAYSRLFSPFYIPKEIDKILYLDTDIICLGDIKELYDMSFEDKTWIAVEDKFVSQNHLESIGISKQHKYINSGVLLINLKKLRKNYKEKDFLEIIVNNSKDWIYPDQDFINKVFSDDIKVIQSKYNLLAKGENYNDIKEKPLIIHYAGCVKPWNEDVSRFNIEFLEHYYEMFRLQGNEKIKKLNKILEKHRIYGYKN